MTDEEAMKHIFMIKRSMWLSFLAMLHFTGVALGQKEKHLKPVTGHLNDFTKKEQQDWQHILDEYNKINTGGFSYEKLSAAVKLKIDSLEMGYGPLTEGPGCSWYCGGQMYKVSSPSVLKTTDGNHYDAENLHDFNLFTAWVPDTAGGPVGKKVSFHFKPLSEPVSEILIYNGYIKNSGLFHANARVKQFKLYINNVYYATLDLADHTAQQSFKTDALQSVTRGKDLVLTFEITAIYKGALYPHVAVSEINFSGKDVH